MTHIGSVAYSLYTGSRNPYVDVGGMFTGYNQMKNTQASLSAQMDYERYLAAANARAMSDWYDNVGKPQHRTIRYPEFSYAGQIYRANTSIARAGFDYDTASANYFGNLPYRTAGLYGITSRVSRSL